MESNKFFFSWLRCFKQFKSKLSKVQVIFVIFVISDLPKPKKRSFLKVETSCIEGGQPACKGTGWASG